MNLIIIFTRKLIIIEELKGKSTDSLHLVKAKESVTLCSYSGDGKVTL